MKNITVSVDDETYRRARMKAAAEETSVSAVVKRLLAHYASTADGFDALAQEEAALRVQVSAFDAGQHLARDALHRR